MQGRCTGVRGAVVPRDIGRRQGTGSGLLREEALVTVGKEHQRRLKAGSIPMEGKTWAKPKKRKLHNCGPAASHISSLGLESPRGTLALGSVPLPSAEPDQQGQAGACSEQEGHTTGAVLQEGEWSSLF